MQQDTLEGLAFIGEAFTPENVRIVIENGRIAEITERKTGSANWIVPAFFNAHTHIADTVGMDTPIDRPLPELVAPPNGLKHRLLRETPPDRLVSAMRETIAFMKASGTLGFADFREGGPFGVGLLRQAADPSLAMVIFGRDGGELTADGFGLSSAKGTADEEAAVSRAKAAGKLFAVHAGEAGVRDIDSAFALDPDLIIHAVHFTKAHIREAADRDIPIVVCPRSNWRLGATADARRPPVHEMLEAGCRVFLGTDNVMFVSPDMFAEAAFLQTVYKTDPSELLRMMTGGFSLPGRRGIIEEGQPADLVLLDGGYAGRWTKDPAASLFTRIGSAGILRVISGGYTNSL
ncbi:5'-deoxyadenosine deaminase [bioreactor metagenome]|uniref:5'-deoxyadenosine deaminase n=1 Tax=bioreactor metagenome TaxID=1076179 RepID=A0A644VPT1_9ZZZZ|nr:amidohydrolase family protein [Methanocorpusculum sp.]